MNRAGPLNDFIFHFLMGLFLFIFGFFNNNFTETLWTLAGYKLGLTEKKASTLTNSLLIFSLPNVLFTLS